MIGVPDNVYPVLAEPYEDDTPDVSQYPDCLLAAWIVKERNA
jgi:hypothetical protein